MNTLEPRSARSLVGHGLVVILLGLLIGFPYALVLTGSMAGSERAWRMAHLEGVLNGLLLVAIGAARESLALSERESRWLAWALILTAYGNVIASAIGAAVGERGLSPEPPLANLVVYAGFIAAVVAVLFAIGLAVRAAFRSNS